jgi:D-psicose/D-tagatose/L-ribulose 3-epimerase
VNRRRLLLTASGVVGAALASRWRAAELYGAKLHFKYSICNEVFEKWEFAAQCRAIKAAGYEGVEIAPFTLADHLDEISAARRRELSNIMRSEGIQFAGLHWLLITPKWLHITTADRAIREKSWAYFKQLIDFCADLGDKGIMVLGSPKQRASQGSSAEEATRHLKDGLAKVAPHAGERGITILIEPLAGKDTDVVNTLDQAVRMVEEIRHPAIQTMFDFHNTPDEREALDALVKRHFSRIRHIHVNEMDGRYPGTGNLDFRPVFQVLADLKYSRWVSLEVFDFKPGPEEIARAAMDYFRKLEAKLKL